ncbi:hypothetical protein V5O48_006201 [Marasmius crinis-equi]|uniref:C2H2-type domain-containing protein n=1 Tax=Marasmius crinis-equi TaxID=585013 RepID=A0ABR3FKE0_9AGAR
MDVPYYLQLIRDQKLKLDEYASHSNLSTDLHDVAGDVPGHENCENMPKKDNRSSFTQKKTKELRYVRPKDTVGDPEGPGSAPWDSENWADWCTFESQPSPDNANLPFLLRTTPRDSSTSVQRTTAASPQITHNPYSALRTTYARSEVSSESSSSATSPTSDSSSSPTSRKKSSRASKGANLQYDKDNLPNTLSCQCARGFWEPKVEGSVYEHLRRFHDIPAGRVHMSLACPWVDCDKHYTDSQNLATHFMVEHFSVGFKCDGCSKVFRTKGNHCQKRV